jgi:trehalose utilization protein
MKVLVIAGDYWHPAEVIKRGFSLLEGHDYEFDFVETAKDIISPAFLENYSLIICCKSDVHSPANHDHPWFEDSITYVPPEGYAEFVEKGGGFIALHAGLVLSSREEFKKLYRAAFNGHPPQCEVRIKLTGKEHPVLKGVEDFAVRDEHYQMELFGEINPLFDTESDTGGRCIGGYTLDIGQGRLCALSPGHNLWVFENENFKKLLLNAMDWCAQRV